MHVVVESAEALIVVGGSDGDAIRDATERIVAVDPASNGVLLRQVTNCSDVTRDGSSWKA